MATAHPFAASSYNVRLEIFCTEAHIRDFRLIVDIFTLVRVSHIHLFGISFIFFIVGIIFSHAYVRPVWLKCVIMGMPFVCLFVDVISWYLVKVYHPFAWATMGAGGMMALSFAVMWVISLYQMWFSRTPAAVAQRHGVDRTVIG